MRIVVTGAGGQLGRQLAELVGQGQGSLEWRFVTHDEWDVADYQSGRDFLSSYGVDLVVNCAAFTAVDRAESVPDEAYRANAQAPEVLLKLAEEEDFRLIQISTDYVFNGQHAQPLRELDSPNPACIYAISKHAGELAILHSPRALVIRTGWLYSVYGHNFFLTMARRCQQGEMSRVVYDQVGTPTWCGSLAGAIETIVEAPEWRPGLYHFADQGVASWYDFAHAIYEALGMPTGVTPILTRDFPQAAPRPAYSVLDCRMIERTFDIKRHHWHEQLMRCLAAYGHRA